MDENSLNENLARFEKKHKNNWQYLIFTLRKHMDVWRDNNVKNPFGEIKHSYVPVLFNIPVNGSTVTQIGHRSMIVKQNISRTVKELESKGMIAVQINNKDKRSDRLNLTPQAKQIVLDAHVRLEQLQNDYKKIVGEDNWNIATDVLLKIIAYHENLNKAGTNGIDAKE